MRALAAAAYGPLEDLEFIDLPRPVPGPGQVLVRTEAAALNAIDKALVTGAMRHVLPVRHPFVPGVDVSGVIEAVGVDVTRFTAGEAIMAWNDVSSGALAEYVLVEATAAAAVRPAGLTPAQAAALPTAALTAAALLDISGTSPGDTVLVVGAGGGVGSYLVQLAVRAGLVVFATGRTGDQEFLDGLGALHTIDYQHVDITEEALRLVPGGVDVVFDLANTGPALARTAGAARSGGRLVSPLGGPASFERGVSAVYGGTTTPDGRLAALAAQAATGELHIAIGADYAFTEARRALVDFAHKHIRGKVTITF
ncbi:zinc-binding dehydrogenase [Streptomyces sp. Wb2n-11]|uniref:zinc-binding dehydrogenase n=1 Tax=Streptomyces sp. Wb2n-11 TaxID=1030533 RepID=UPI000B2AF669|nr:zinc-binding dehydrogenase [Streptomyces sp. Wb2n-11]